MPTISPTSIQKAKFIGILVASSILYLLSLSLYLCATYFFFDEYSGDYHSYIFLILIGFTAYMSSCCSCGLLYVYVLDKLKESGAVNIKKIEKLSDIAVFSAVIPLVAYACFYWLYYAVSSISEAIEHDTYDYHLYIGIGMILVVIAYVIDIILHRRINKRKN